MEFSIDSTTIHINGKIIKPEIYFKNIKDLETELNLCEKLNVAVEQFLAMIFPMLDSHLDVNMSSTMDNGDIQNVL